MPKNASKESFPTARPFIPERPTLAKLRLAAATCTGCDLYQNATQTVFGEGPENSVLFLIGEQPGDREDREGKPFIGPAGQLLDRALREAGIPREKVYVTNAVKHFKWVPRGKRRLHDKPRRSEILACRPWLETEIATVKPRIVVCLGATAAQSLLGTSFKVTKQRGVIFASEWAPFTMATIHPSALLRIIGEEERREAFAAFVADLKKLAPELG